MSGCAPLALGLIAGSDREVGLLSTDLAPHVCHPIVADSLYDFEDWLEREGSAPLSRLDALVMMARRSQVGALATLARPSRKAGTPILALDPGDSEVAVTFLLSGADLVLPREAGPDLISANVRAYKRVRSAARRAVLAVEEAQSHIHRSGPIVADLKTFQVSVDGHAIDLPPRQFDLLVYLMARPGQVVTRCEILNDVWGIDFEPNTNIVNVYIHYLRRKLRPYGLRGVLQTVRGRGFCFSMKGSAPGRTDEWGVRLTGSE